jgi:alanyl-tRNA synthetase
VQQKGSLVNAERTRFDFAHNAPVTDAQILAIEAQVNAEILNNAAASAKVMDIESAKATGAMMLFGEKYGESVRVLEIGSSKELCGGVHVQRTGDIGLFKIVSEGGMLLACAVSKRSPVKTRWRICKTWKPQQPKRQRR